MGCNLNNFSTFEPCICCGLITENGNTFHHLLTRKAHPEFTDVAWNKIPVCQLHHLEFHSKGTKAMAIKFSSVKIFLLDNNWELFLGKWIHS